MTKETPITLQPAHLRTMVEEAAQCGAKKALAAVGLHDENAATDLRELRGVLEAWRQAKTMAWSTVVRVLTTAFLAIIAAALGMTVWSKH